MFIHPMWDSENQRLGLKRCTPFGYLLRCLADLIGFAGLLLFISIPVYLGYQALHHRLAWKDCWLLLVPLAVGTMGRALFQAAWKLAAKKRFRYDPETRTAKWFEGEYLREFPKA